MSKRPPEVQCSFCHKARDVVERLVSSRSNPEARICDECLAVCNSILMDDGMEASPPQREGPGHCLMCDPRTPRLLSDIEQWAIAELSDNDPFLARARRLAGCMMGIELD